MSPLSILLNSKRLIGTNGEIYEKMVGPQQFPPGIISRASSSSQSLNMFSDISYSPNGQYNERYWKFNGVENPIYALTLSSSATTFTGTPATFDNNGTTYTIPSFVIPLKDKQSYTPLWDATVNSSYNFYPTTVNGRNTQIVSGFTATPKPTNNL